MAKILISPSKYIQGPGELSNLGTYAENLGKKALVIISESGYKRVGKGIESGFEKSSADVEFCYFNGECSSQEVDRIIETYINNGECDMIFGVGGGKIADTAKAVGYYTKKPVGVCPTVASSDAPCSALSVLYTEDGVFDKYLFLPKNPDIVMMDTDVISKSPVRLTVSGIGDALATYFEARACKASGAVSCAGGTITQAAMALAELCLNTLLSEGFKAKVALEAGVVTESVEKLIEANTLLSGLGFESGGLAGAHAIHNGLTALEEAHNMYHGEKVAFGTCVQLILEDAPLEEIEEIYNFCIEMGLPVTLEELGVTDLSEDRLMEVARLACSPDDTIHNMPFEVNEKKVYSAIIAADNMGRKYLGK